MRDGTHQVGCEVPLSAGGMLKSESPRCAPRRLPLPPLPPSPRPPVLAAELTRVLSEQSFTRKVGSTFSSVRRGRFC